VRTAIHEIRNQLAVAVAAIEAFLDRKMEPTDARFEAILFSLREIDALVDELPRDRTIEFETHAEPIDICALIGAATAAMEGFAIERDVTLKVRRCDHVHPGCSRFLGDPLRIGEIVTNVLTNAIHHTGAGGSVEVDCRQDGGALRIRVDDRGPGIDAGDASHLFEKGFRGASAGAVPGSGLGLAVVKAIVEDHGGTVEAENRSGGGATFTLRLPVSEDACAGCQAHAEAEPTPM
jgi:signal transduction histidine kinase